MLKSNEWYTPAYLIEAAREVMGSIDLDPASCALAQETVRAGAYYSKEQDGLTQGWYGNVWLNPPFSYENKQPGMNHVGLQKSIAHQWIQKLIGTYNSGDVKQAIILVKADPKQIWFSLLWEYPVCFFRHVYFSRPEGKPERHMFGTALVYLGPNDRKFTEVFSKFGTVAFSYGYIEKHMAISLVK